MNILININQKYIFFISLITILFSVYILNILSNRINTSNKGGEIVKFGKENEQYLKFRESASFPSIYEQKKTEIISKLKRCEKDNIYCKSMLGNAYFDEGIYDKAFDLLVSSQGDIKGYRNMRWAPSEYALGYMYAMGIYVKKNQNEAKKHFTICALSGNDKCARWLITYLKQELETTINDDKTSSKKVKGKYHYYTAARLIYWYNAFPNLIPRQFNYMNDKIIKTKTNRMSYLRKLIGKKQSNKWSKQGQKLSSKWIYVNNLRKVSSISDCLIDGCHF